MLRNTFRATVGAQLGIGGAELGLGGAELGFHGGDGFKDTLPVPAQRAHDNMCVSN